MKKITPIASVVLSVLTALTLLLAAPQPASAYVHNGAYFSEGEIGDGWLQACFEAGTPVFGPHDGYVGEPIRGGLEHWSQAINLHIANWGSQCFGANIEVRWDPIGGGCGVLAQTSGHSANDTYVTITFNSNCASLFYWGTGGGVPNNQWDTYTVAAHEMGHALGLGHTPAGGAQIMDTNNACFGSRVGWMAYDDANGIRARYPTHISNPFTVFPYNATCID